MQAIILFYSFVFLKMFQNYFELIVRIQKKEHTLKSVPLFSSTNYS